MTKECQWCHRTDSVNGSIYCRTCLTEPMRTPGEIVRRMHEVEANDWLGTMRADLGAYLDADDLRQFCTQDAEFSDHQASPRTREHVLAEMQEYMPFALDKATGHRGISASRSVDHYKAWVWLLGDYAEIVWDNYAQYGMPILRQICERYGFDFPQSQGAVRMSRGESCEAGCDMGCDR
jgi:hypothetical protein